MMGFWGRAKGWLSSPQLDGVIRAIVALSAFVTIYLSFQVQTTAGCLRDYIQSQAISAEASRAAATEDRHVVDDMVISISHAKSAAETRAALATYIEARRKNDALRAAHPPPSSVEVCS
jgi:hypothetical protein